METRQPENEFLVQSSDEQDLDSLATLHHSVGTLQLDFCIRFITPSASERQ